MNEVAINRNIVVLSTRGRSTTKFTSTARTWGELKAELEAKGYSLVDCNVMEGISRVNYVNPDIVLPVNQEYRGKITNDLMLFITPIQNIKSGASRSEIYDFLKQNPHLKGEFVGSNGYPYTNQTTEYLQDVYDEIMRSNKQDSVESESQYAQGNMCGVEYMFRSFLAKLANLCDNILSGEGEQTAEALSDSEIRDIIDETL